MYKGTGIIQITQIYIHSFIKYSANLLVSLKYSTHIRHVFWPLNTEAIKQQHELQHKHEISASERELKAYKVNVIMILYYIIRHNIIV